MEGDKRGSMTIFAALSLMLVAAFLFVLLEAGRAAEMQKLAKINTQSVLESVFAGYESALWDTYHLLAFDAFVSGDLAFSGRETEVTALSNENLEPIALGENFYGNNLLQIKAVEADFSQYRYLTDEEGTAFEAAVAAYMRSNLPFEAAQQIFGQYEAVSGLLQEDGSGASIEDALSGLEDVLDTNLDETEEIAGGQEDPSISDVEALAENPLEVAAKLQNMGILELVIEDTSKVSAAAVSLDKTVSHRTLQSGSCTEQLENSWLDYVLMQQYLVKYMGSYTNAKENRALSYELEYLICGNASDVENLKGTVNWLILVREAANLLYLLTDAEKQNEALEIATIIAAVLTHPELAEGIKSTILAVWAYAESIMDLRALLDGDKIPLLKNSSTWTSDIWHLATSLSSFGKAKSSETGLSYSSYAGLLLFFQGESSLAFRAMDVIEAAVQKQEGHESFYMDHMVIDAELNIRYEYHTVFFGMEGLTEGKDRYYSIIDSAWYSYRKAGA